MRARLLAPCPFTGTRALEPIVTTRVPGGDKGCTRAAQGLQIRFRSRVVNDNILDSRFQAELGSAADAGPYRPRGVGIVRILPLKPESAFASPLEMGHGAKARRKHGESPANPVRLL